MFRMDPPAILLLVPCRSLLRPACLWPCAFCSCVTRCPSRCPSFVLMVIFELGQVWCLYSPRLAGFWSRVCACVHFTLSFSVVAWNLIASWENWLRRQPICLCERHAVDMSLLVAIGTCCGCSCSVGQVESFPTTPTGAEQSCPQTWKAEGSNFIPVFSPHHGASKVRKHKIKT